MRILALVYEDLIDSTGGLGVHCLELYRKLAALNCEVTVIAMNVAGHQGGCYHVSADSITPVPDFEGIIPPNSFRLLNIFNTNDFLTADPTIQKFITDNIYTRNMLYWFGRDHFDIIHTHDAHVWRVAEYAHELYKCPIVLSVHLSMLLWNQYRNLGEFNKYVYTTEARSFLGADEVITVSTSYRDLLEERYGIDVTVIHNGVNADKLAQYERKEETRALYGYTPSDTLVGFIGRMVPQKGVQFILEAVRKRPDLKFVFISTILEDPTIEERYPLLTAVKEGE